MVFLCITAVSEIEPARDHSQIKQSETAFPSAAGQTHNVRASMNKCAFFGELRSLVISRSLFLYFFTFW